MKEEIPTKTEASSSLPSTITLATMAQDVKLLLSNDTVTVSTESPQPDWQKLYLDARQSPTESFKELDGLIHSEKTPLALDDIVTTM